METHFTRFAKKRRTPMLREETTTNYVCLSANFDRSADSSFHRRRSIFISGSALTSPGTCVTVNAHSPDRCETLSLSMTDITHSRTSRWLLRIPYGNARLGPFRDPCTCEIGTTVNARALLPSPIGPHCLRSTRKCV